MNSAIDVTAQSLPEEPKGQAALAAEMATRAHVAAAFLKALSHGARLMILCNLVEGEKSVSALEAAIGERQASVSQHLARLRAEGMVSARRDGKLIYYALADERVRRAVSLVYDMFCKDS